MCPAPAPSPFKALAQQANAEGITWLVASGDDGAAMCDTKLATHGAAVSLEAALPEATGVGGTMFTGGSNYWSSENNINGSSALSYIPETVWNESTDTRLSASGGGYSIFYSRARLAGWSRHSSWDCARSAGCVPHIRRQ